MGQRVGLSVGLRVGAGTVEARRVAARRVGPRRVGGPKFQAFFDIARRKFRSFFSLWGSFSWNRGRGPRRWHTQSTRFGLSWVILCELRRPSRRRPLPPHQTQTHRRHPRKISVTTAATAATAVARRSGTLEEEMEWRWKKSKENRNSQGKDPRTIEVDSKGKDPSTSSTWVQCKEWCV